MTAKDTTEEDGRKPLKPRASFLSPGKLLPRLFIAILIGVVLLIHSTPDLSRFEGRGEEDLSAPNAGEAGLNALKEMASPGQPSFRFEEANINRYLARLIKGRHQGWTGDHVDFEDIAIDLQDDAFEILITRRFLGRLTSQSARFSLEKSADSILLRPAGGYLGRLPLPNRLHKIGRTAFAEIARVLQPEIKVFLAVEQIDFLDGAAEVHPFQ